ncbi:porin [Pectobacterium aroidearum]|uniref:porin n=1 Tax=Pectobacterium aroidearum TaxID=1201031 RepID=UPI0032EC8B67
MNNKKLKLGLFCTLLLLCQTFTEAAQIYNKEGNKLYLDGRVIARRIISDNENIDGDKVRFRMNIHGETKITETLYGYGRFEHDFNAFEPESAAPTDYTRYAYAGLNEKYWGSISYGRNDGVLAYPQYTTMIFPINGGGTYAPDTFMGKRGTGILTWQNNDLFGFIPGGELRLQYQGKNEGSRSVNTQNGNGYGIAFGYAIPSAPLEFSAAWALSQRTLKQQQADYGEGDSADGWMVGMAWQPENWYIGAFYGETENMQFVNNRRSKISGFANKAQNLEAGIRYRFPSKLTTAVGYRESKAKNLDGIGDALLVRNALLFVSYPLNANFSLSAEYSVNLLKDNNPLGLNTDDATWLTATFIF